MAYSTALVGFKLFPFNRFPSSSAESSIERVSRHNSQRRSLVTRASLTNKSVKKKNVRRGTWFSSPQSEKYLDGSLPGDIGFDPLGLCDPEGAGAFIDPRWLVYAEIINARWAMLGAAGMIAPEVLDNLGLIPAATGVLWFKSGVIPPLGSYEYWADPYALFTMQMVLVGFAEHRRGQDYYNPGYSSKSPFLGLEKLLGGSKNPAYPGGFIFNFAGLGKKKEDIFTLRTKELKNGRLAMLACLGYFLQALVTGVGPYQNLKDHLVDPFSNNLFSSLGV
eukprot:TRINITY_DN22775_c0_g1_i2.p1 TRINITY_DN22775_c0_g1~~TRINITY_DN22775_c0_g1_i2.p1  ORF type:complete len:278 (+),score=6.75 TRINITY_DN22775_c0_g1_i2:199-1032(+)